MCLMEPAIIVSCRKMQVAAVITRSLKRRRWESDGCLCYNNLLYFLLRSDCDESPPSCVRRETRRGSQSMFLDEDSLRGRCMKFLTLTFCEKYSMCLLHGNLSF